MNPVLNQNKSSWDAMADTWFGSTALPVYGCLAPTEDELHLFPDLSGKKVLDIGCGSGHSLCWCGQKGAAELWGLDLSEKQISNAQSYLTENGYHPRLYNAPMEQECGLPKEYFDVVYSIYAIGWTTDLKAAFCNIASYLKPGGVFIFSWDHPLMSCVDVIDDKLVFSGSYIKDEAFSYIQRGSLLLYRIAACLHILMNWQTPDLSQNVSLKKPTAIPFPVRLNSLPAIILPGERKNFLFLSLSKPENYDFP